MVELELLGLHGDGEHLTLSGGDGQRYRLAIDDALRAAVRRDRPGLEALRAAGASTLRPKDIQALVRAGASVEEVAAEAGLTVEHVRRYEGPVLAERAWVVQQAQAQRLGHEADAPRLGDLVVDRLAARGVTSTSLLWDAVRRPGQAWEVLVTFVAGDREREARWQIDLGARSLHAVSDEARWLSETEMGPSASPRRHLTPVGSARLRAAGPEPLGAPWHDEAVSPSAPSPAAAPVPGEPADSPTDALLAELAAHRGTRVDLAMDDDVAEEDPDGFDGAHPPASRPEQATDAHVLSLPRRESTASTAHDGAPAAPGTTPALPANAADTGGPLSGSTAPDDPPGTPGEETAGRREDGPRDDEPARRAAGDGHDHGDPRAGSTSRRRKTVRRSVPSWDEIVFGAKPE
ncbi:septation protein SepH [Georgenia yuyongxinii]